MRVLIGTYRKRKHIEACVKSLRRNLRGVTDVLFVDDSGDPDHAAWLEGRYGWPVVSTGRVGYTGAMQQLCAAAGGQQCFVLEEDFTIEEPVDLAELSDMLWHRPYLAQVALLRQPVFDVEHEHGGVIEALIAKGHQFDEVDGLIEHTATFTANPSVWRADVFDTGWPAAQWSEVVKRDELISRGYRFAYLPRIRVQHHGEREGFGY